MCISTGRATSRRVHLESGGVDAAVARGYL
jgi:hypothetical protein